MRFPPQFLDELRARLPVSEVAGRRVKLRKAGREWKGLSPFNQEKTPSFFVNDQKGFFHDFSSGQHGDIFDFLMATEGVAFPEAVERLAAMAGMAMPAVSRDVQAQEQRRKSLHEVMELAAKFFEAALAGRSGAKARGYLADRGIAPATQLQFRIGYAPGERFALKEHLGGLGVAVDDMIETGLLIGGDDIPVPYDRFRDRVMFPISDLRGRIVAFGGRALEKGVPAKYLNSPETPLFHKGSMLYNGGPARQAAHDGAPLIAVEGYVDVIAMVTAGFPATVAPLGTALTEDQLALMWKISDEPILCFDGDNAGKRAAYRAVDVALPRLLPGKSLKFALLPDGQDPDDLVRAAGRAAVLDVLETARPLADMLWTRETEAGGFDTPERRAALESRLGAITNSIADEAVRRYYRQDFQARLTRLLSPAAERPRYVGRGDPRNPARGRSRLAGRGAASARGFAALGRGEPIAPLSPRMQTSSVVRGSRSRISSREALILTAVVNHPWLLETHAEEFSEIEFLHPDANELRRAILEAGVGEAVLDADTLRAVFRGRELTGLLERVEAAVGSERDPTGPAHARIVWTVAPDAAPEDVAQWWKHVVTLHRKQRTLNRELRDAERALGEEPSEANLAWLKDVQGRLSALDGSEALIEGFGALSGRPVRSF